MRVKMGFFLLPVFIGLSACKTVSSTQVESGNSNLLAATDYNFMAEGFKIRVGVDRDDIDKNGIATEPTIVVESTDGRRFGESVAPASLSLDQTETAEGDIIFAWPNASHVTAGDYEALGEQMVQYSQLVGTVLKRTGEGPGEIAWANYLRTQQHSAIEAKRALGPDAWCNEVISQLVNELVPSGSTYRQYGNCGEGGRIGACLARTYGFESNKIRLCLSANDHFFAMVHRGLDENTDYQWHILDRWDLIGHFSPFVDIDDAAHEITYKGTKTGQEWFQRAGCAPMDEFLEDPRGALYNRVGTY